VSKTITILLFKYVLPH